MRTVWLIAKTVLIEAVRRKEVYAIVVVSLLLIAAVMTVNFFEIEGLAKFYREIGLKIMGIATALTVIALSARQLPREFENRTIYPLLAKPISRPGFILGKVLGVTLAAAFCFALFMTVFIIGSIALKSTIHWALLGQYLYLQMILMLVLATLSFWLSLLMNLDAAITLGVIFYVTSSMITAGTSYLYDTAGEVGQLGMRILTYALPQLTLFDLTEKAVHAEAWPPLSFDVLAKLTLYGSVFIMLYLGLALLAFRRRAL